VHSRRAERHGSDALEARARAPTLRAGFTILVEQRNHAVEIGRPSLLETLGEARRLTLQFAVGIPPRPAGAAPDQARASLD
jgi:hypothetical protein